MDPLTHGVILVQGSEGWGVLLVHGMRQADEQLIGSCPRLLVHLLNTQNNLAHHAGHHLHSKQKALKLSA